MKLIFLDVDGVLNTNYTKEKTSSGAIFVEDNKVKILKQIIDKTDGKVVLSSTWKYGWILMKYGVVDNSFVYDFIALRNKLREFNIELYDKTPLFDKFTRCRGEEIQAYLNTKDDIEGYIIIDDMNGRDLRPCGSHLLQTSERKGLQEKHIKTAERIMNMEV